MSKRINPKEYLKRCKESGYDLPVEDYITTNTKIRHICNQGHIYMQEPRHHLEGVGCPKCRGNYSYTPKEYLTLCKERGYDLPIEDYKNSKIKIKHRCSKGHIYEQTPHDHLKGNGCFICNGNFKKTPKQYYKECKDKGLDLPIEDYVNNRTKIKHKCNQGHIYLQKPNAHLNGQGCPKCSSNYSYTPEDYYSLCKENDLDIPIENYIDTKTKIKHKCSNCGNIYEQTPNAHLSGQGCPKCSESHGEKFIRKYLDKNNINYIPQKKFHDLKDKTYLSYDFYLPDYNILIEYQGIQHYEPRFGNSNYFKKQQHHDKMKREYAKKNGYKLLELHYSLDNQEKVNKYLSIRIKDCVN